MRTGVFEFGDLPIEIHGSERHVSWLGDQYGRPEEGNRRPPAVRIDFGDAPLDPDRPPDDHDGDGYDVWWNDMELHVSRRGYRAWMTRGESLRVIIGSTGPDVNRNIQRYSQYGLSWTLARSDQIVLHCAAVSDGNDALLMFGHSGVGKSTAVLAALHAGLEVLADDLVIVRNVEGSLIVTGVARNIVAPLDMVTAAGMADDIRGEVVTARRHRAILDRSILTRSKRRVVGSALLGHHDSAGELELMNSSERAAAVTDGYAIPAFAPVLRTHLPMTARLAELPMWGLHHAASSAHRLDTAARFMRKALDESRAF